jgi:hypothetical protein
MNKNIINFPVVLGILCVLVFPGCTGPAKTNEPSAAPLPAGLSAEQIRDKSLQGEELKTYAFDMTMKMYAPDNSSGAASIDMNAEVQVDKNNKKMHSVIQANYMGFTQNSEEYVVGDTQYTLAPQMGWLKKESATDLWADKDIIESQKAMMKDVPVSYLGTEKVDGVDCYVLEMKPDKSQMSRILGQQATGMEGLTQSEMADMVKEMTMKEWVAKDTYMPKKIMTLIKVERTGKPLNMEMTMDFSDYNKEINIQLPADAKNARDMNAVLAAQTAGDTASTPQLQGY